MISWRKSTTFEGRTTSRLGVPTLEGTRMMFSRLVRQKTWKPSAQNHGIGACENRVLDPYPAIVQTCPDSMPCP